ncbi:hypothetical protein SDC9_184885 [bioreactor metagenome]|uniref:Uncharacterized protein n=1 Tax=bioreactor metagenome TaxID=1076179 RepID=A0A645HEA6_9ZZZZ
MTRTSPRRNPASPGGRSRPGGRRVRRRSRSFQKRVAEPGWRLRHAALPAAARGRANRPARRPAWPRHQSAWPRPPLSRTAANPWPEAAGGRVHGERSQGTAAVRPSPAWRPGGGSPASATIARLPAASRRRPS